MMSKGGGNSYESVVMIGMRGDGDETNGRALPQRNYWRQSSLTSARSSLMLPARPRARLHRCGRSTRRYRIITTTA